MNKLPLYSSAGKAPGGNFGDGKTCARDIYIFEVPLPSLIHHGTAASLIGCLDSKLRDASTTRQPTERFTDCPDLEVSN